MDNKSTGNGIGLGTVLFLIFLVLKLTGHITWSWFWVFSPFWIPLLVFIHFGICWLSFVLFCEFIDRKK